jgi:hypothetical protein
VTSTPEEFPAENKEGKEGERRKKERCMSAIQIELSRLKGTVQPALTHLAIQHQDILGIIVQPGPNVKSLNRFLWF